MVIADEACTARWVGYSSLARRRAGRRAGLRTVVRPLGSVWVLGPALVGLAALVALALVYLHVACLDTGHRILALEKELEALRAENEQLQLQALRLSSPARVEREAKNLGMVPVQVARTIASPAPLLVQEGGGRETASWLGQVYSFLAALLEGQGVLAGPAR